MIVPLCWPIAGTVDVYGAAPGASHVVVICVPSGTTYSTVPGEPFWPWASVVVYAETPLVKVVVTVAADGDPYRTVPLCCPCAGIVDVYGFAPAESQVVDVCVPRGGLDVEVDVEVPGMVSHDTWRVPS